MTPKIVSPDEEIIKQNDTGLFFYMISQGACEVRIRDIKGIEKTKVKIHDVNYFWKKQVNYKAKIKHFIKRKLRINVNNY